MKQPIAFVRGCKQQAKHAKQTSNVMAKNIYIYNFFSFTLMLHAMLLGCYYGFNPFVTDKSLIRVINVKFRTRSSQNLKKKQKKHTELLRELS